MMSIQLSRLEELPEDKICELIRRDPTLIYDRLPRNELYCLTAVQQHGSFLECVPKTVQTREICLTAVRNYGKALKYVSPRLLSDEICVEAVKNDAHAIDYVPKHLISRTLLLEALSRDGLLLEKIDLPDLNSEELIVVAVSQNGLALKYVEWKYLRKSLCLLAVQQNGLALEFVPTQTKGKALCREALLQNPLALQFVPDKLKTAAICEEMVLRNPMTLQFVPNTLLTEELCIMALKQNALVSQYVPAEIWTENLCLLAVTQNAMALQHIPIEMKSKNLCDVALRADYRSFQYIPVTHLSLCDYIYVLQTLQYELMSEELAVQAKDNLFLVGRWVADWPDEIKEDAAIISLSRSVGLQKIVRKKYDPEGKMFFVEEKYFPNKETKTHTFSTFQAFYSYLDGDISGADLYAYDFCGIDLREYTVANAGISSDILDQNGLYDPSFYNSVIADNSHLHDIQLSQSNELVPAEAVLHQTDFFNVSLKTKRKMYYISDLHLDHKVKKAFPLRASKKEIEDFISSVIQKMIDSADERSYDDFLLIAGDVAYSFELSEIFYSLLVEKWSKVICVLGNHELWDCSCAFLNDRAHDVVEKCVLRYKALFKQLGVALLHNDMLYLDGDDRPQIICESKLVTASESQLCNLRHRLLTDSSLVVLGGTGFSGYNTEFNATNGLYCRAITTREDDLLETKRFEEIYRKLSKALEDVSVVVLTHMPKEDWTNKDYNSQWIYVNGHNHRNQFFEDQQRTVYSDNQIGYQNYNSVGLKYFLTVKTVDIFKVYPDGIHKITRERYLAFNRGKHIYIRFNRSDGQIYMLKNDGTYCFLLKNQNGLYLLDGGVPKSLENQDINYYYQRMPDMSAVVNQAFEQYYTLLNRLSQYIRKIGGSGSVHGSIIDIDFYNHIIVNPETLQVTPYYAESMVNKVFYPDLQALLLENRPDLHTKFLALQSNRPSEGSALARMASNNNLRKTRVVSDTNMYKQSALAKKVQYLMEDNIIRLWKDSLLTESKNIYPDTQLLDAGI